MSLKDIAEKEIGSLCHTAEWDGKKYKVCEDCDLRVKRIIEAAEVEYKKALWSQDWPTKPGFYWFYGRDWPRAPLSMELAEVFLSGNGHPVYICRGAFINKLEGSDGFWTKANLPNPPEEIKSHE